MNFLKVICFLELALCAPNSEKTRSRFLQLNDRFVNGAAKVNSGANNAFKNVKDKLSSNPSANGAGNAQLSNPTPAPPVAGCSSEQPIQRSSAMLEHDRTVSYGDRINTRVGDAFGSVINTINKTFFGQTDTNSQKGSGGANKKTGTTDGSSQKSSGTSESIKLTNSGSNNSTNGERFTIENADATTSNNDSCNSEKALTK